MVFAILSAVCVYLMSYPTYDYDPNTGMSIMISIKWLAINIVIFFSLFNFKSKLRISLIPAGSSPLIGSSKTRNSGLPSRAIAIPSLCFIPQRRYLWLYRKKWCWQNNTYETCFRTCISNEWRD